MKKEDKELLVALEAGKRIKNESRSSALKVNDVQAKVDPLLTEESLDNIKNAGKIKTLLSWSKDGSIKWKCRFFGVRTATSEGGISKIAKIINLATERGYKFAGILSPVIQLPLIGDTLVTSFYVALRPDDYIRSETDKWVVHEGATEPETYLETPEDVDEVVLRNPGKKF